MTYLLLAPGVGTAPPLAAVVTQLARRHGVYAHDPGLGSPTAVLARPSTPWRREWAGARLAWWVEHPTELPATVHRQVDLIVTWPPVVEAGSQLLSGATPVVVVPAPGVGAGDWQPIVPFVRARLRRRLGLPERLVVIVGTPDATPIADDVAADALRLCAAAVVGPGHVLRSLALATPTVCDAATADLVGAVDGRDVVVASGSDARAAAEDLAGDQRRATLLARAGRLLVAERHDAAGAARRIAAALALPAAGSAPVARVADELEALGTPLDATVTGRVATAVASLGGRAAEGVTTGLRW